MGLLKLSAAICAGAAISAGAAVLTLPAAPLAAATPAELDTLVSASAQPASGIALARKQIRAGNMLDALATHRPTGAHQTQRARGGYAKGGHRLGTQKLADR